MIATPLSLSRLTALLREGDLLDLGARAAAARVSSRAGYREDGAVLLVGPDGERLPTEPPSGSARRKASDVREVHLLPGGGVGDLRDRYPGAWIHAAQPVEGIDSLGVMTGPAEVEEGDWNRLLELPVPKVAAALYGPQTPPEALAARLERLRSVANLRTVVWLPVHPGDMLFLPDRTTDGTADTVLLAATRLALPPGVRVRASWAAYGWKMGQFALTFGVDEVAGWGLEEELAWGREPDPAAVVSREEAEAGIAEALREPVEVRGCAWES